LHINTKQKIQKKKSKKPQWSEPSHGRQKGKAKERPKDKQPVETKEGRELVPLVVGSYLTHINQLDDAKKNLLVLFKETSFGLAYLNFMQSLAKATILSKHLS
jgi:hypothetical protein